MMLSLITNLVWATLVWSGLVAFIQVAEMKKKVQRKHVYPFLIITFCVCYLLAYYV